ncbi:hypothetical protein [Streptomyces sp. NPDC054887]
MTAGTPAVVVGGWQGMSGADVDHQVEWPMRAEAGGFSAVEHQRLVAPACARRPACLPQGDFGDVDDIRT